MEQKCGNCHWYYNCREHNFGDYCYGWMSEFDGKKLGDKEKKTLNKDKSQYIINAYNLMVKEYLSKFNHCDECVAEYFCIKNDYVGPLDENKCSNYLKEYLKERFTDESKKHIENY